MTPNATRTLPALVLLLAAVLLAGCAVTPQTPEEGIAATYTTIESLADTAATAHAEGYISDRQRERVADRLQQAHDLTTGAREALEAGQSDEAGTKLSRARAVLSVVRDTLEGM